MTKSIATDDDEIPAEVDFPGGVRGKHAVTFPRGSRVVLLDADVAEVFQTQEAANDALRSLAEIIKRCKLPKSKKQLTKAVP